MFDADLRKLIFGKEEIQILPQTAILLKHFLEAPDYILKDEEIKKIFWSDKSNNDPRLHNAISRLRRVLRMFHLLRFKDMKILDINCKLEGTNKKL